MAYNQFTMVKLQDEYGLTFTEMPAVVADAPPVGISDWLRETLKKQTVIGLRSGSEKARSEYIIAPILLEVYEQMQEKVNLFSGVEFNVDQNQGLAGICDFLFSLSPLHREIQAPIIAIVEAKKENINSGIPQCFAELVAAQIFNARDQHPMETLYGVVTNGEVWKFLRLRGTDAVIDTDDYYLGNVEKLVGIFLSLLRDGKETPLNDGDEVSIVPAIAGG